MTITFKPTLGPAAQEALRDVHEMDGFELPHNYLDLPWWRELQDRELIEVGPGRGPNNYWHRITLTEAGRNELG